MKFKVTPPDENFPILRMVSEGGKWEVGYVPMIFGVRVRLGQVGNGWVECDLCCGPSLLLRAKVLCYILATLLTADEAGIDSKMMRQLFPQPTRKPLDLDPIWEKKLEAVDMIGPNPISTLMLQAYA